VYLASSSARSRFERLLRQETLRKKKGRHQIASMAVIRSVLTSMPFGGGTVNLKSGF
jgi:hypothetical protein